MKAFIVILPLFLLSCSTPPKPVDTKETLAKAPKVTGKTNISDLFACFNHKGETTFEEIDNKNGFIHVGSMIGGVGREGYSTYHLFKDGNKNIVAEASYSCGPACEQYVRWYQITRGCKIRTLNAKKFLPAELGEGRFIALPKKGFDIFIVEAELLDYFPEYEMNFIEKYTWKENQFIKDEGFESFVLPMTKENVEKYFK